MQILIGDLGSADLEMGYEAIGSLSRSAILPNSAAEFACILRITCPRCTVTVISVVPSVDATCFAE